MQKKNLRDHVSKMTSGLDKPAKKVVVEEDTLLSRKSEKKMDEHELKKFMERNQQKQVAKIIITDFGKWKKKNKVEEGTKVFCVSGGYKPFK